MNVIKCLACNSIQTVDANHKCDKCPNCESSYVKSLTHDEYIDILYPFGVPKNYRDDIDNYDITK